MISPGIHDISAAAYHADPCPAPSLSASIAKLLVTRTPLHAWTEHPRLNPDFAPDNDPKFDIGTATHALVLHDERAFCIIEAADYRTKAAQEARLRARAAGQIPLLTEQWARVNDMVKRAREQLAGHAEAAGALAAGKPEQTLIWQEGKIWCRARLDWLHDAGDFYDDYKSTECADPDAFTRTIINVGHDIQAAFYLRGIKALKLSSRPQWRWIVQEVAPPHPLAVIAPMPGMLELAERKVAKAIALWTDCMATGHWPGYPARTCYVDVPGYHETQYLEREVRDEEAFKRAADAFAP